MSKWLNKKENGGRSPASSPPPLPSPPSPPSPPSSQALNKKEKGGGLGSPGGEDSEHEQVKK